MRTYTGTRHRDGRLEVTVTDGPARVGVNDIADLVSELRSFWQEGQLRVDAERREDWISRKNELLARIEASSGSTRRPLWHRRVLSEDGFEWGYAGSGPADLAHAILTDHLGVEPTTAVRSRFRDDVVAHLPRREFTLTGEQVAEWVVDNRELVDGELFLSEPAQAVTDLEPPPLPGAEVGAGAGREATASVLIAACEAAWDDIRYHHPELPEAVIVLGSGVERGRLVKLGHWWGGQWVADGQRRGEVLLAGEALHLEPSRVFEVLLHEAAHGINAAKGIKDTSRGGRYHNKHFAATANHVLLKVRPMPPFGLADTSLTPAALERYAPTIERLGEAMRIARYLNVRLGIDKDSTTEKDTGNGTTVGEGTTAGAGQDGEPKTGGWQATSCSCGRKMRMATNTLAAGPVMCGLCGTEFSTGAERSRPSDAVVDTTFVERRQAALEAEDHAAALGWYRDAGTPDELPMPVADDEERSRRTALARELLAADGTLTGVEVTTAAGPLRSGDRLTVTSSLDDLPEGTLGTVTSVDAGSGRFEIDFATWGRVTAGINDAITSHIAHDYAQTLDQRRDPTLEIEP